MTSYQDHILSDRDRKRAIAEISNALSTMDAIMKERTVTDQRGYAYTDDDTDLLREGRKALDKVAANPQGAVARHINESLMATAGRAVDRADLMLDRNGFQEVKNVSWTNADREVISKGLEHFNRVTAHQRN